MPPAKKARLMKMREANSIRPRMVRREFTKTCQRSPATAASCWRACGAGLRVSIGIRTLSLLLLNRATTILGHWIAIPLR